MLELFDSRVVLETRPFRVESLTVDLNGRRIEHQYFRINCPDWVNVVPLTSSGKILLIRQPRAGTMSDVLEIPGGAMEPDEKDATMTAVRELEEETGFTSRRVIPLASINPNPAIMTNRLHMMVAFDCQPATNRVHFPDPEEHISLEFVDPADVDMLVRTGRINHALASLALMLAMKYLPSSPPRATAREEESS